MELLQRLIASMLVTPEVNKIRDLRISKEKAILGDRPTISWSKDFQSEFLSFSFENEYPCKGTIKLTRSYPFS
jgi:hypothetical protein